jgi:DNA-binding transcriptional MocR family regulator
VSRRGKPPVRLSQTEFERWLDSPEARDCVYRRGPPGQRRPLVVEAAQHFGVERRTIERALARIARRQRLLAEHQPIDAATAGLLLDAAKSFVVGLNTTRDLSQIRHTEKQPTTSESQQEFKERNPPSRHDMLAAIKKLLVHGVISLPELLNEGSASADTQAQTVDGQLAAVGLRPAVQVVTAHTMDPVRLTCEAVLDALDAYESCAPTLPATVQAHVDGLRQALIQQVG